MSLLDIDERILDLVELVQFDKSPINDLKTFTGRCRVGFIEGACANEENVKVLQEFRGNCDLLIAVGDCAVEGGIPAMRNFVPLRECIVEAFIRSPTTYNPEQIIPNDNELPLLLDRVYSCQEVVKIDYCLPGCPPSADTLWEALTAVLEGRPVELPYSLLKYD
jgi:NAD-reducing hydrogenase small subunit